MLIKLRNWCKKAKLRPGFVCADGMVPSPRPETFGGLRNKRRCASYVVSFVLGMITFEVLSLYGTYMVLDPSLLKSQEFVRTSFFPCSFSARRFLHHLLPPSAPRIIVVARAIVASTRVRRDVFRILSWNNFLYFSMKATIMSSDAEWRRVDCAAISLFREQLAAVICLRALHFEFLDTNEYSC